MIFIKTLAVLSLVVFAASVDNKKHDIKEDIPMTIPRGIQENRGYQNRNTYSYGNSRYAQRPPSVSKYNIPQRYNYQNIYQNRGRPYFTMPPQPTNYDYGMNYGNVMDPYGNASSFNNGYDKNRRGNNKTTIGSQDFSGVGKQGLGVEFTDDGMLVNGKKAPEYDVGNQGVNVDMTGDGIKINGQEVRGDI